jgi:hypothetical protein
VPLRYDAGILHKAEPTPQGGVRIPSYPTRVGVLTYRLPDGTVRRELRPPEEVFDAESLVSLKGAPVTDLHPERDGQRIPVTAENWRELAVGHAAEDVAVADPFVSVSLLIQDQKEIGLINAQARKELSSGYECQIDPIAGVWGPTGEVYDVIQRRIRYNHIALGPENWGRAGSQVALRLDSGDAIEVPREDKTVDKVIVDGKEYVKGSTEHLAALEASRQAAIGRADAAEKTAQGAPKGQNKPLAPTTQVKADAADVHKAAVHRARLLMFCAKMAKIKGVDFKTDAPEVAAATDNDLASRLILLIDPSFDVKDRTPDYLAGALETMIKMMVNDEAAETGASPTALDAAKPPAAAPGTPLPVKTDSKGGGDIFKARQGQAPAAGENKDRDAARYDADSAQREMLDRNKTAHRAKLAFTK